METRGEVGHDIFLVVLALATAPLWHPRHCLYGAESDAGSLDSIERFPNIHHNTMINFFILKKSSLDYEVYFSSINSGRVNYEMENPAPFTMAPLV